MATITAPITPVSDSVERERETTLKLAKPHAHILSVSEYQTDHTALRRIIDNTQWRLTAASSCRQAFEKLSNIFPLVVFSESSLPDGTWKDVFELILRFDEPYPFLVVTSRLADESLWSEVLQFGGFDVLTKPLIEEDVRRVLDSVWTRRTRSKPHNRVLRAGS
jgi:DNA-binding NtrC family response regulator